VAWYRDPGVTAIDEVLLDAMTAPQRGHADTLRGKLDGVASRFLNTELRNARPPYVFPRNIDPREGDEEDNPLFPFRGADTRIAVIHADISGLGETYLRASGIARTTGDMLKLSTDIERAVEEAAKAAVARILIPATHPWKIDTSRLRLVPARPIVLAGDDFTIIIRADLALPFTAVLLEEIEKQTEAALKQHPAKLGLPGFLSACAGVAIVKRGQPFLMAYEVADGLCSFAKRAAKSGRARAPFPSGIAFHLVGSTMQEDYGTILASEMTAGDLTLTANPYWLGRLAGEMGKTSWSGLHRLAREIKNVDAGRGGLRRLRALVFEDMGNLRARWKRWCEVAKPDPLLAALTEMGVATDPRDHAPLFDAGRRTPLFDALDLIDIGTGLSDKENEEEKSP
jgi:hypothetical protein